MTVRVMGLGDSITNGNNGDIDPSLWTGYRKPLYDAMVAAGWAFDFVGTQTSAFSGTWDQDHEGHPGYQSTDIASGIPVWITAAPADIILLLIGINDIGDGNGAALSNNYAKLLEVLHNVAPRTTILASTLTPAGGPSVSLNDQVVAHNQALPGIVAAAQAQGARVVLARAGDQVFASLGGLCSDGIHLSQSGYAALAAAWLTALHPYFETPATTTTVQPLALETEVYVSLDGSGAFTGADDRLLGAVRSITLDDGRDGVQQLDSPKIASGDASLRNEGGRFSAERADSAYYQRLIPGKPVQYQAGHGTRRLYRSHTRYRDHVYYRGRGVWPLGRHVLDDLGSPSEIGQRQAALSTLGWETLLARAPVTIPVMINPLVSECFTAYLDAVGWPIDKRDIATSDTRLLYYWADERIPWDGMLQLLASEGPGAFGVRRNGTFYFENRNYRTTAARATTSQATYYDRVVGQRVAYHSHNRYRRHGLYRGLIGGLTHSGFHPADTLKSIYNRATYTTQARTVAVSPSVIWSLGSDLVLSTGQPRTFIVKPSDPFLNAVTPILSTDYTVAGGTVAVALSATSGLTAFLTILATSGTPTVSGLQLRATTIAATSQTTFQNTVDASASIARFSPIPGQNIPLTFQVQGWPEIDPAAAEGVCDAWVLRQMWPRPKVNFTLQNGDVAHLEQILKRQPSDRITLVDSQSGISADFWINTRKLTITDAQGRTITAEFGAELCDTLAGAVWDTDTWDSGIWGV